MKVGFTGSQHGPMPRIQAYTVIEMLYQLRSGEDDEFHHGCNKMRDDQVARIAKVLGYRLMGHPPTDRSKVGTVVNDFNYPPLPYLERNHRIVDDTQILLSAPLGSYERLRSGTWATTRFAARRGEPGFVIWPDGHFTELERAVSTGGKRSALTKGRAMSELADKIQQYIVIDTSGQDLDTIELLSVTGKNTIVYYLRDRMLRRRIEKGRAKLPDGTKINRDDVQLAFQQALIAATGMCVLEEEYVRAGHPELANLALGARISNADDPTWGA